MGQNFVLFHFIKLQAQCQSNATHKGKRQHFPHILLNEGGPFRKPSPSLFLKSPLGLCLTAAAMNIVKAKAKLRERMEWGREGNANINPVQERLKAHLHFFEFI